MLDLREKHEKEIYSGATSKDTSRTSRTQDMTTLAIHEKARLAGPFPWLLEHQGGSEL